MATPTHPVEIRDVLEDLFDRGKLARLEEEVFTALQGMKRAGVTAIETTVQLAELVYARHDDVLPVELLQLGADAALVATEYNFDGFRSTGRGPGIEAVIRKLPGIKKPVPASAKEPPARAERFVKRAVDKVPKAP